MREAARFGPGEFFEVVLVQPFFQKVRGAFGIGSPIGSFENGLKLTQFKISK